MLVWTPVGEGRRIHGGTVGGRQHRWEEVTDPSATSGLTARPVLSDTTYRDADMGLKLSTTYYYRLSTVNNVPGTTDTRKEQTFECG